MVKRASHRNGLDEVKDIKANIVRRLRAQYEVCAVCCTVQAFESVDTGVFVNGDTLAPPLPLREQCSLMTGSGTLVWIVFMSSSIGDLPSADAWRQLRRK